jgi:hypothetical protein
MVFSGKPNQCVMQITRLIDTFYYRSIFIVINKNHVDIVFDGGPHAPALPDHGLRSARALLITMNCPLNI